MILTTAEAAERLRTHRHRIDDLRRFGLLHAVRLGRGYGYRDQELERFTEWAEGKDLGNRDQIKHWARENQKERRK